MSGLVDIIIPFYNTEKYLPRAIQSAAAQTYPKIRIILVDDGSTDESLKVAQDFQAKDERVHIITTENGGPGHARNLGLENAEGEYIVFLDADDELDSQMVEKMQHALQKSDCDGVLCRFTVLDRAQKILKGKQGWNFEKAIITGKEAAFAVFDGSISCTVWAKMFYRKSLTKLKFHRAIWFQDLPFIFEYYLNTNSLFLLNESLVNIHSRPDSIVRQLISPKRLKDAKSIYRIKSDLVKKYQLGGIAIQKVMEQYASTLLENYFILHLERDQIDNSSTIEALYLDGVHTLATDLKINEVNWGPKQSLIWTAMQTPKHLPWTVSDFILKNLQRNKFRGIAKLKLS